MKINTRISWVGGSITVPYQPWLDSPVERLSETNCCVWHHLKDGFVLRHQKTGDRLRVYHRDWDKTNGAIVDLRGAELPEDQESFDQLLRECLESVKILKS